MTEDQFFAWLLFALPVLLCFGKPTVSFQNQIILALFVSIFPIGLFFIAEKEFIKDCKKGYKNWEESILPQIFYRRYLND